MGSPRLTDHQEALMFALGEVVLACRAVIEANERRRLHHPTLTGKEQIKIGTLRIALDNLSDVQANRRTEAS